MFTSGFCEVINTASFGQVAQRGISPLQGDYMINWITSKFKTIPLPPKPKCARCGLGAVYIVNINMHLIKEEDNKTSITTQLCVSCKDKVNLTFSPKWLPPPVIWRKE